MTAEEFNRKRASGSVKIYLKPQTPANPMSFPVEAEPRGSAYTLSSGKAVVPLKGKCGTRPLSEIEVVQQPSLAGAWAGM